MLTTLWGYIMPIIGVVLVVAAAAAFVYVPIFGRWIAAALLVVAAGLFAFDEGYRVRGSMDQSAALKADIVELQRQADASKAVAENAAAAERAAEATAAANQQKVDVYVNNLAKNPGCSLSDDDVQRLLDIK
jgi:hypothetical protein